MATRFEKLNHGWNAEPNAPDARVLVEGGDVILGFHLNHQQFPRYAEEQRARVRFTDAWRYRLGPTNDEGWHRGQCRFSGVAPAWGEFYEVTGDLLLERAPNDWIQSRAAPEGALRHFLFYLRDGTFECDARAFVVDLGSRPIKVTLVMDASFGESLAELDQPLWVCDSPINRVAAERLWSRPNQDVTVFKRVGASEVEAFDDVLPALVEHHPGLVAIAVVGGVASAAVRTPFARLGPGEFIESAWGFTFVRSA